MIVTEEQERVAFQAFGCPVTVRDSSGRVLGYVESKLTPEQITELKRRAASPGPWYTGVQVQARLRALQEEWDRTCGFDEAYRNQFLARLDEADPGHFRPREQA